MISNNYLKTKEHYTALLSDHYTWTFGGSKDKQMSNLRLLSEFLAATDEPKIAVDLGCGSGFQSIPLLQLGYSTYGIDACKELLDELLDGVSGDQRGRMHIAVGDMLGASKLLQVCSGFQGNADVVVCMGDTLTHLASLCEVKQLLVEIHSMLNVGGKTVLQFRDLREPLKDTDRFIPVRSDERTVFTCFLEWEGDRQGDVSADGSGCTIKVHDLVHVKKGIGAWELCKSWYSKLGLSCDFVVSSLIDIGFVVEHQSDDPMVLIVAKKVQKN